jgi:Acetyltransferase (GNAT) domain
MEALIPAISKEILESELNDDRFIRETNNGNNRIYVVNAYNAPNTLKEIGRLRELTFRQSGGGTGKDCDLDEYDTQGTVYNQLIVWNPADREIVGGYRFIECGKADRMSDGNFRLATCELFKFSERFINDYLPYTIELGRSFVQPQYQPSSENRKGLFSLDNLWDGLGAIIVDYPSVKYFFGKVTMYSHFDGMARDLILSFMHHMFPDHDELVSPLHPLPIKNDTSGFISEIKGLNYKDAHRILNGKVRDRGANIPPLFNSYMNLSATMKTFGTSLNSHFGDVEETGILVTIADIYESKKERHITSYRKIDQH